MLNWYILQRTRWFNQMHYLNDQTFAQSMTQTMKTWLCFQITCFSISLTWTYNKKLQWWMILMAVQPKHWNSFWKQHPHQWQKDWRIGKLGTHVEQGRALGAHHVFSAIFCTSGQQSFRKVSVPDNISRYLILQCCIDRTADMRQIRTNEAQCKGSSA